MTVVFADLVGSTALSGRLDPEDMARLVRQYQDSCAGVIARFDGFLAKFMGDGVLAYFGYPQAHEDSAERAARAGLEIAAAVARIGDGTMAARVGIATGLVVVGEIIGSGMAQEQTIVGDTPNLAARLQALAEPGCVLIAGITRRLLGELFDYAFLGEHALKGIERPVGVWRVLRESGTGSRFHAVREAGVLVGREQEIALLAERWRLARAGEGQVVLSGEAGIGKSRLVEALVERIRDERHVRVRMQYSPYHRNTALYPVIRHFGEAAGFGPEDGAELRRDKLRSMLAAASPMSERAFGVLAGAIGLGRDGDGGGADMTAAQIKSELMDVLAGRLLALAEAAPVLLLLEDAHWVDPTTRELFDAIVDRIEAATVAVIITHRPEFVPSWTGRPNVTALAFNRMSGQDCAAIVRNLAASSLPADLVEEILRRSDGVPLYLEELTKAVLEAGTSQPAVPPTLQDSLMARLDRLGRVKDVAQMASVIGREFQRPLLAAVAGVLGDRELDDALLRLVEAGLVFPRGNLVEGRYSFKHALVQEAAYESLLRARRQPLHAAIGRALEASGAAARERDRRLSLRPRTACTRIRPAIGSGPATHPCRQSSYAEAVANYQSRDRQRTPVRIRKIARRLRLLSLLLKLGPAANVSRGMGTEQFGDCYREAYALARKRRRPRPVQVGVGTVARRGRASALRQRRRAGRRADRVERPAQRRRPAARGDPLPLELGAFPRRATLALALSAEGAAHYVAERHHRFADAYAGHDPGVCALSVGAISYGVMGLPVEAKDTVERGVALAERLHHPHSLAHALNNAVVPYTSLGDAANCARGADQLLALAERYNFAPMRMAGEFHAGWASIRSGDANGLARMEAAFARRAVQAPLEFYYCAVSAVTCLCRAGAPSRRLGHRGDEARARGHVGDRLLRARAVARQGGAGARRLGRRYRRGRKRCLEHAAAMAGRQGARLLELRAAMNLGHILAESGRRAAALARLAPLLAAFPRESTVGDVRAAARLAATLA